MMQLRAGLILCLALPLLQAQPRPEGIQLSTWVREDIFAGFMAGDWARFDKGVKKIDTVLQQNPRDVEGLAWRGAAELSLAVRAHEEGKTAEFEKLYAQARSTLAQARQLALNTPGMMPVHAITGGVFSVNADKLPANLRRQAWEQVYENYLGLKEMQKEQFDKMPVHMRGEVLAGLAQAAQRLGKADEAKTRLQTVIDALPNSTYASRAKRWQENPELSTKVSLTCQTCHDPGRLEPSLARLKKQQ